MWNIDGQGRPAREGGRGLDHSLAKRVPSLFTDRVNSLPPPFTLRVYVGCGRRLFYKTNHNKKDIRVF